MGGLRFPGRLTANMPQIIVTSALEDPSFHLKGIKVVNIFVQVCDETLLFRVEMTSMLTMCV
jgi:hypothetical protein